MQHIFALENEVLGCVMAALKAACASIVLVLHPISLSRLGMCHDNPHGFIWEASRSGLHDPGSASRCHLLPGIYISPITCQTLSCKLAT